MKIAFATLGCRTNQHDTAEMQTLLAEEGHAIVPAGEAADVYVINTCTVTRQSDRDSRLAVRKSLGINGAARIIFTGCYAQLSPDAAVPGVDLILGNANKLEVARAVRMVTASPRPLADAAPARLMSDINGPFRAIPVSGFAGKSKAFIKAQTGCGESCSFCTVVKARGSSRSDTRDNVLRNARAAIDAGFKEITLTGINLGAYGMDLAPRDSFSALVEAVLRLPGDFRVRLSSVNPMEIDDELMALLAGGGKLCPHLHIPLQSGDDEILARMRRNYTAAQYVDTVQRLAARAPELGLGADVIVGFPGETAAQFANTCRLAAELPFSYLHVFTYSPRPGTEAAQFADDVPAAVKKERHQALTALALDKARAYRARFAGRAVSVLVETQRDAATGFLRGHSGQYFPVIFAGGDELMGRTAAVTVKSVLDKQVLGCVQS